MNCADAKLVPILDVCARLGAKKAYVSEGKGYALFHAPYREDAHPSLRLDLRANRWVDMATGQYGDVVDLVRATLSLSTADALSFLNGGVKIFNCYAFEKKKEYIGKDLIIKSLRHPVLLGYAASRGISTDVLQRFCREAHCMSSAGKPYFAIAFPTITGGYELRNKGFKGCCGRKGITVLGSGPVISFFEGFFDFLAHVQLYGYQDTMVYVILNSTAMVGTAVNYVAALAVFERVELWLDNDSAGRMAKACIQTYYPAAVDKSYIYAGYNDLNDYLIKDYQLNIIR